MSRSTFTMAAAALAATASAAFSANSNQNVVVYWGQGSNVDLSTVCQDPSIDIVNLAFVNEFPQQIGDYPKSNFANSCWELYPDPKDSSKSSGLYKCAIIGDGMKTCHDNGKKVLLSLGGGLPDDYYLPNEDVAKWFGGWLLDAFGPMKSGYTGPRPFGTEAVDGFDLDLEANPDKLPNKDLAWQNYAALVNQIKTLQPGTLISAAPQCEIEDVHLANAIKNAPFDMIFTQFYNTPACSARLGFQQMNQATTDFTFQAWSQWLIDNSQNKAVKLYMGLPAGTAGAGSQFPTHYLKPEEAYSLISKYKTSTANMGGVMLWSHTVSNNNVINCHSYSYWMKSVLQGTFRSKYNANACISSTSSARPSTSSSVRPSSSSVRTSSSMRVSSSSVRTSSSIRSSSARPSSSSVAVSSSSIAASSSKVVPSSTSAAATPTATIPTVDGSCGVKDNGVVYTCKGFNGGSCCSEYGYCGGLENGPAPRSAYCGTGCNPLYGDCDSTSSSSAVQSSSASPSSSKPASSSVAVSSSAIQSSSVVSSSAIKSSSAVSSSAIPSSSVVSTVQSSASASASKHDSSSVVVSSSTSAHASSSVSSYSASTPIASSSASVVPSSSVASSSVHVDSSSAYTSSHMPFPTGGSSVYPTLSSAPYPIYNVSSTHGAVYPDTTPAGPSSTPCSTSSKPVVASSSKPSYPEYPASSSKPVYPASSTPCSTSSKPVVPASSSKPSYPEYPASSKPSYPEYPASSKPSYPEYPASSMPVVPSSKPVPGYPEYPASSTTKVVTTTYVDTCETGLTTKTETITKTICNKCNKPEEDSVTSVYVCHNCGPSVVTVTITKPNVPATGVPAKPTGPSYGGDKPQTPAQPSKPSGPSYGNDKPNQPVYSVDVKKQNDATSTTVQIVYVTKTPVPAVPAVPSYTPVSVGYPSGPAKNGTSGYPTKPTGTGVPTKPTYAPPQFTGAASRLGAGLTGVVAIAAGLLVL